MPRSWLKRTRAIRWMSSRSARIHPIRSPPQTDLPTEPIVMARPWVANGGGIGRPSSSSPPIVSSMIRVVPCCAASSTVRWRSSVLIDWPVGLWKSGMR